jgi:uncharacterized protein YsxB (DUF464 family)
MMSVSLSLTPEGCLERLEASGHMDGGERGENLACAAATALLRTAAEVMHRKSGVLCAGEAPVEGSLILTVRSVAPEAGEWVRGVTDFLIQGCRRLQTEAEGSLVVRVQRRD